MNGRVTKKSGLERRKERVRKKVQGSPDRPRLNVFRSNKHIYAQIIDDSTAMTLVAASSMNVEAPAENSSKSDDAKLVGLLIGRLAIEKGISKVVFDRNGYIYHGRVKTLADAAREAGLLF